MRKLINLLLLTALVLFIISNIDIKNFNLQQTNANEQNNSNVIKQLQKDVAEYKNAELEKKKREEELKQQLQNPEIIKDKFKKVGNLVVYEGVMDYKDIIKEDSLFASRKLDINLKYKFGISIDFSMINVGNYYGDTDMGQIVVIQIPKNKFKIEYVELDTKNSEFNSTKSWLAKQYKPEDIDFILKQSKEKVTMDIMNDKKIFDNSMVSLKESVKGIVVKLGWKKPIFEEV